MAFREFLGDVMVFYSLIQHVRFGMLLLRLIHKWVMMLESEQCKKVHEMKLQYMTVTQYYVKLNSLWQEFDYYQVFQVDCPSDAVKFQKLTDKERFYDFFGWA